MKERKSLILVCNIKSLSILMFVGLPGDTSDAKVLLSKQTKSASKTLGLTAVKSVQYFPRNDSKPASAMETWLMWLIYLEEVVILVKGKQCKHGNRVRIVLRKMLQDTIPLLITIVMTNPKKQALHVLHAINCHLHSFLVWRLRKHEH